MPTLEPGFKLQGGPVIPVAVVNTELPVNVVVGDTVTLGPGSAIVGNVRIDQTTPGTTNGVQINAALPAGSNIIGKTGIDQTTPGTSNLVAVTNAGGFSAPLTITRPANQTPYGAGDVVGGALTFPTMGPSAGRILITSTQLELDITAIPTGMTSFLLYLYNVTPPSALADNAVFDLPSGDRASFLGVVAMGTPADLGSTLYAETNIINKQLKLAGTSLFGYLTTVGGFTPAANSEVYVATLHAVAL